MKKLIIGLIGGGVVGGSIVYHIRKKELDELYNIIDEYEYEIAQMTERIEELKKSLDSIYGDSEETYKDAIAMGPSQPVMSGRYPWGMDKDPQPVNADKVPYWEIKPPIVSEESLDDPADFEHPEDDEEDYPSEASINNVFVDDHSGPYIITQEMFESYQHVDEKISLTYYAGDDTLVDDGEEPIDDVEYSIGVANLDEFDESGILYVRNEKHGTDYEIIRVDGSYSELVLGIQSYDDLPTRASMSQGNGR